MFIRFPVKPLAGKEILSKAENNSNILKVCFFQAYYTNYIRSQTLYEGLSKHNLEILPCIVNEKSWKRYFKAILCFIKQMKRSDVVITNFRCWEILPILRLLTKKPIFYDAHISIWQSLCEERQKCKLDSMLGKLLFWMDAFNCRISDRILIDTKAHADYFSTTFSIPRNKFLPIYISCESSLFNPIESTRNASSTETRLFWAGSGIPLQGLEVIVEAMKLVSDLQVHLVVAGSSPILDKVKQKSIDEHMDNISFLGRIPREQVAMEISNSDICLGGHYSKINKAKNVIAGKLFEMIAMKKPVIAGDSKAVRELFTHKKELFLCEMGSPTSLAQAISELHRSPELRKALAESAYDIYHNKLLPEQLVVPLVESIRKFVTGAANPF